MPSRIVLKKKKKKWLREMIVVIVAVVLTTVGIKASDNFSNRDSGAENNGPCPNNMVLVTFSKGDFCMDKYEVSASTDCAYIDPQSQMETTANLDIKNCQAVSEAGAMPWRNISQDQAVLACAKAGKRLPTHEEWYYASLGTPDNKMNWGLSDCQVNNNWSAQPGPTGSGKDCYSSAGAYDMIGNVWEWVNGASNDGVIDGVELPKAGYVDSTDGNGLPVATNSEKPNPNYKDDYFYIKHTGWRGMARGGYWDNKSDAGQYSVYMVLPPSSAGSGIGFRCAK